LGIVIRWSMVLLDEAAEAVVAPIASVALLLADMSN
jgi:hypothetical protein